MRKRAIFISGGAGRFKPGLRRDERGITPVVGAILVIAVVIIRLSVFFGQLVPP